MRALLPLFCLTTACTTNASNAALAELPGLSIDVTLISMEDDVDADDTAPQIVEIDLLYDETAFRASHADACATLGGGTATMLGQAFSLAFEGSDFEHTSCATPYFRDRMILPSHGEAARLEVTEDVTLAAEFPAGAIEARIATLVSPTSWSFHEGDTITLAWSHPADLVDARTEDIEVLWHRDDAQSFLLEIVAHDATTITAMIPVGKGVDGAGSIYATIGQAGDVTVRGETSSCQAKHCRYSSYRKYDHRAHLAP